MKRKRIREGLSKALELPQELMLDVPRLVMDSDSQLWIENYKGILEYAAEEIRVRAADSVITVAGEGLAIQSVTAEELYIVGQINTISYQREG